MRVVVLSAYYEPEQYSSLRLDVERFRSMTVVGTSVTIYTPMPTRGVSDEVRNQYRTCRRETHSDGKLIIYRFPLPREGKNSLGRAMRYVLACVKQLCWGIFSKAARTADVMFISSTPPIQGAMAALIKKVRGIPYIYNLQDIFPDSLVGTGMTKRGSLLWEIGRVIEDFTYRNADKIIVISQDFKRNIRAKGVPEEKIEVIYNWVEEDAVVNIHRSENKLFDLYNLDREKFYITYCGNIGLTQNMDLLLSVAKELQEYPDIHFVLVGEGAYKKQVERIVREDNLYNVTLLPFQPYAAISEVFSLGDIGLIISKPGVGENSLPSKTWSIMSAERAVVANFDRNELEEIIQRVHCGIFTEAGDKEAFKEAILTLYKHREQCVQMGKRGREFVLHNLTKEIGTRKIVELIKQFEKSTK